MTARIDAHNGQFLIRTTYSDEGVRQGRGIPAARWSRPDGAWVARAYYRNVEYIKATWPDAGWSTEADALATKIVASYMSAQAEIDVSVLKDSDFKTIPDPHQKKGLLLARDKPVFAYLMEQGTGKTKLTIDDAAYQYRQGRIDALVVVAPNSVKTNWVSWDDSIQDEIDKHLPDDIPRHKAVFNSDAKAPELKLWADFERRARATPGLIVISVNYEALLVKRCFDFLDDLCSKLRVMIVFDESTRLKKPGRERSKAAKKLRKKCKIARILTGTFIIKSPLDAYNQFAMLDESILGFGSYYAYRNHFCNMGGFQGKQVLSYKNLDELVEIIAPYSFRVTKKECMPWLPDKIPMPRREVEMTKAQVQAYRDMQQKFAVEHKGDKVEASNVLGQILRLQQITGGYVTHGAEDLVIELVAPEDNPKVQEAIELLKQDSCQAIVWARFTPEIDAMCKALEKVGISYRRFDGSVSKEDRLRNKEDFLAGKFRVMVANQQAGGVGQDWYTAELVIYLSNSFSTEDRVQSEDRAHRRGTKNNVVYYDIVVKGTEDIRVLRVIKDNIKISDIVAEALEEWHV